MSPADEEKIRNDKIKHRIDLWMHHNTLMWSRSRYVYWIQLPVLAGIYSTQEHGLYQISLAVIGIVVTLSIGYLISLDIENRRYQRTVLNEKPLEFDIVKDCEPPINGGSILLIMCVIFVIADIFLLITRWNWS